jgi:hypothetical protein
MARVVEQVLEIRLSRIVKDSDGRESTLPPESISMLLSGIPELVESIIDDPGVVVEVTELD